MDVKMSHCAPQLMLLTSETPERKLFVPKRNMDLNLPHSCISQALTSFDYILKNIYCVCFIYLACRRCGKSMYEITPCRQSEQQLRPCIRKYKTWCRDHFPLNSVLLHLCSNIINLTHKLQCITKASDITNKHFDVRQFLWAEI